MFEGNEFVQVLGPVGPAAPADTYPTHYAEFGKGGLMQFGSVAARDLIPQERRVEGLMVVVTNDPAPANNATYILDGGITNTFWKKVAESRLFSSSSVEVLIATVAPLTRKNGNALQPGDFWFHNVTATLYLYYGDEDSSQWIQLSRDPLAPLEYNAATIPSFTGAPDTWVALSTILPEQLVLDAREIEESSAYRFDLFFGQGASTFVEVGEQQRGFVWWNETTGILSLMLSFDKVLRTNFSNYFEILDSNLYTLGDPDADWCGFDPRLFCINPDGIIFGVAQVGEGQRTIKYLVSVDGGETWGTATNPASLLLPGDTAAQQINCKLSKVYWDPAAEEFTLAAYVPAQDNGNRVISSRYCVIAGINPTLGAWRIIKQFNDAQIEASRWGKLSVNYDDKLANYYLNPRNGFYYAFDQYSTDSGSSWAPLEANLYQGTNPYSTLLFGFGFELYIEGNSFSFMQPNAYLLANSSYQLRKWNNLHEQNPTVITTDADALFVKYFGVVGDRLYGLRYDVGNQLTTIYRTSWDTNWSSNMSAFEVLELPQYAYPHAILNTAGDRLLLHYHSRINNIAAGDRQDDYLIDNVYYSLYA